MPPVAGAQLGHAQGAISIDTSDLRNVTGVSRAVSQQVAASFGAIDASVKRTQSNLVSFSRSIGQIKGELTGLSVGAGIISGMGLNMAGSIEEARIQLEGMTGGAKRGAALMETLQKRAMAAGLPFGDILRASTQLLPTLKKNTEELEKWLGLSRRVAVLRPSEGIQGAAFSVNEMLVSVASGNLDLLSLAEKFGVGKTAFREAMAAFGNDAAKSLDHVLNQMGITEETAERMGKTFNASLRASKDAALQLLAEGFTPLLQTLTPILQQSATWLATLRQTNPAIAQMGAGLTATVAVGAPLLLLFNQLIESGTKLKALGVLGGLGRAGVIGGAAAAGVGAGLWLSNTIGSATGNKSMQEASLESAWLLLRKLLVNIANTLIGFDTAIRTGLVNALRTLVNAVISAASAIANTVGAIGSMLPGRMGGNALTQLSEGLRSRQAGALASSNAMFDRMTTNIAKRNRAALKGFMNFMVPPGAASASGDEGAGGAAPGAAGTGNLNERNAAIHQWAQSAARIDREAAAARLDAQRQYEQQRSQTIAQYNQNALREEQDFQRNRARQLANYQREIANVQAAAAKREAAWQADYNERIADLRQGGNDRLQELERNYNRDRERRERDHRDRLLDAAARLDAVAVAQEQRRYSREQADAATAFQEQQAQTRNDLAERLQQEQEAHQERLQAAREADQERLQEMQRAFEEQIAQEDLERAIQQERRAEDYAAQLAQMDAAHSERLAQIAEQAAQEKAALNESFVAQLNDLGIYNQAWRTQQQEALAASLKSFQAFWKAWNEQFPKLTQGPLTPYPGNLGQFPSSFADYGFGVNAPAARAAAGGSASSRTVTVGDVTVNIYASPGMDEAEIGRQVERKLMGILTEAAQ